MANNSDSDDSLPFMDLDNLPDEEVDEPEISHVSSQLKHLSTPSTSKESAKMPEESLEGFSEDQLLLKLINSEITYAQYAARMGHGNDDEIEIEDFETEKQSEDVATKFDEELSQSRRDNLRGNLQGTSEGKIRKKRRNLPPALQGLMGQANLCYARGEVEMAEKLCLEIIRQEPLAPEPFLTLSQIYEYTDMEKFLQFSLIAAYLNPGDVDQWIKIAEILVEQGNVRKAITCYTRAIHAEPRNMQIRMRRIELLDSIGEDKYAFRCRYALIPHVPPEEGEFLIELGKKVAEKFHFEGNVLNALTAMEGAYLKVSNLFKIADLNLLMELMIENGAYKKVLNVLEKHCNVEFTSSETQLDDDVLQFKVETIQIPENLIMEFRTKLIVCLVHLKTFHLLQELIKNVLQFTNIEETGDLYLDIAEALMKEEKYEEALQLLSQLVTTKNFSVAAAWLLHADCHRALGNTTEAIESYHQVVDLAQNLDAQLTLAAMLKRQGKFDDALRVLKQNPELEVMDPGLLYERCLLLKEVGYLEDYLEEGCLLVSRHCARLRNRQEMQMVLMSKQTGRVREIKALREQKGEDVEDFVPEFLTSELEPTIEIEWDFLLDLVRTACQIKRFDVLQRITFTIMSAKRFYKHSKEIEFLAFLGSFYSKDFEFSFYFVREYLMKDPSNQKAWNLLNQIIHFAEDFKYHRFLFRLIRRSQVPPKVQLMQGNYFLMAGTYNYAMNEYVSLYKTIRDPIMPLLIAITLTQIASQKYSARKQSLVTQAMAYMEEYRKMREPEVMHEIYYNFGRMFHQFGLHSLALENYTKALEFNSELIEKHPEHLSLRHQIAYNIHLIYKHSGNMDMARKFLYDYIVI